MHSLNLSILQISGPISNKLGGPSQVVRDVHDKISQLGFDTSRSKTLIIQNEKIANASGDYTYFKKPLFPNNYGFFIGKLPKTLEDLINRNQFDLVLLHGFFMWSTIWALRKFRNSHIIIMPHGSLEPYEMKRSKIRKQIFIFLFKFTLKKKTINFFVASESERYGVTKHFNLSPVYVVGLGIELHENMPRNSKRETRDQIVSNSRIAKKKRIDLIIGALTWLPSNYELAVTGDTNNRLGKALIKQSKSKGLDSRVSFQGHLNKKQVDKLLQNSDYLVLPSENENFAISVAEALNHGIPVVLSSNVALSVHVENFRAGLIITELTEKSIAEAIETISFDYDNYSDRAREAAAKLDWNLVILKWADSFSEISRMQSG